MAKADPRVQNLAGAMDAKAKASMTSSRKLRCKKVVVLDSRVADDRGSCLSEACSRVIELATGRSPVAHCVRPEDDGVVSSPFSNQSER